MKYLSDLEAKAYISRMHGLLGHREPIEVLSSTVETLTEFLAGSSDIQTQFKPTPEKWSVRQIYAHLAEGELMLSVRLRQILVESGIGIAAYSQDKWATVGNYQAVPCPQSLEMLSPVRKSNVALLRSLSEEQFSLFGVHEERGRETVTDMVRIWAGHDLNHLEQIRSLLANSQENGKC